MHDPWGSVPALGLLPKSSQIPRSWAARLNTDPVPPVRSTFSKDAFSAWSGGFSLAGRDALRQRLSHGAFVLIVAYLSLQLNLHSARSVRRLLPAAILMFGFATRCSAPRSPVVNAPLLTLLLTVGWSAAGERAEPDFSADYCRFRPLCVTPSGPGDVPRPVGRRSRLCWRSISRSAGLTGSSVPPCWRPRQRHGSRAARLMASRAPRLRADVLDASAPRRGQVPRSRRRQRQPVRRRRFTLFSFVPQLLRPRQHRGAARRAAARVSSLGDTPARHAIQLGRVCSPVIVRGGAAAGWQAMRSTRAV